jgi:hypothetical protein
MSGRTARMLGAMAAAVSGLAMTCAAAHASGERFVDSPRHASINSSTDVPMNVDPSTFKTLTTLVAGHWQIAIDGDTLAAPGSRDGVDSIGFSGALPQNVLGAYVYWPRRVYTTHKRCAPSPRLGRPPACHRVKRYLHTEITEADVAFSTAFNWNQGPAYPGSDQIDLLTVEFHELGHFNDPNRPHGRRCSGSPLTESLGYGEWWRSRGDWYEQRCTNSPRTRERALVATAPTPVFERVVHPLPDRVIGGASP